MIAIIVNSKARNAASIKLYLEEFKVSKIDYDLYEIDSEKLSATIEKCISKYQIILIGGGDGSIRTAAQYCALSSVQLGVLPLGTMNHLAKELGLPQSPKEMVVAIKNLNTIKIDLGEVNGLVFLNNSSVGFYPKFADKRDSYSKFYNKWLSYIPSFIESFKKHEVFKMDIKSKQLNCSLSSSFFMVSNNLYSLKFPLSIKRDSFQKSVLGIYYFKQGKIKFFKIIKSIFNNKKNFEILQSKHPIELHFSKQKEIKISLDGDTMKVNTPLHYKSLPKSLNILINSK